MGWNNEISVIIEPPFVKYKNLRPSTLYFYRKDETEEEKAERLKKWSEFLTKEEQEENDSDD